MLLAGSHKMAAVGRGEAVIFAILGGSTTRPSLVRAGSLWSPQSRVSKTGDSTPQLNCRTPGRVHKGDNLPLLPVLPLQQCRCSAAAATAAAAVPLLPLLLLLLLLRLLLPLLLQRRCGEICALIFLWVNNFSNNDVLNLTTRARLITRSILRLNMRSFGTNLNAHMHTTLHSPNFRKR
jgi:hypothetical protein